jgi:hypothetical protein
MSFVERLVTVTFSMSGTGASSEASNLVISGHRVIARISVAGAQVNEAHVNIFGMSLAHMNALTFVPGFPLSIGNNQIKIEAGDATNGMSVVYTGTIIQAWPDMQAAPEVSFRVDCNGGSWPAVNPVEPSSFTGATKVSDAHVVVSKKMGATPENNGVTAVLDSPYLWGPAFSQMQQLAKSARVSWILENGVCAMWPQGGSRQVSSGIPVISKETGMVGYPMATPGALIVRSLFSRAIPFGSNVMIKSDITQANGSWHIQRADLELDALMPHGSWFAILYCTPNFAAPGGGGTQ